MKTYIQPITEIHAAELTQTFMGSKYSVWDDMGEEGQFSNLQEFEEETQIAASKHDNWDKL